MKILYLPIEIFDRELPSKLLLAIEAISKNFIVYIFDQHEFKANLSNLLPGAVLHKDHADCNAYHIFKEAKQLGNMVFFPLASCLFLKHTLEFLCYRNQPKK